MLGNMTKKKAALFCELFAFLRKVLALLPCHIVGGSICITHMTNPLICEGLLMEILLDDTSRSTRSKRLPGNVVFIPRTTICDPDKSEAPSNGANLHSHAFNAILM